MCETASLTRPERLCWGAGSPQEARAQAGTRFWAWSRQPGPPALRPSRPGKHPSCQMVPVVSCVPRNATWSRTHQWKDDLGVRLAQVSSKVKPEKLAQGQRRLRWGETGWPGSCSRLGARPRSRPIWARRSEGGTCGAPGLQTFQKGRMRVRAENRRATGSPVGRLSSSRVGKAPCRGTRHPLTGVEIVHRGGGRAPAFSTN